MIPRPRRMVFANGKKSIDATSCQESSKIATPPPPCVYCHYPPPPPPLLYTLTLTVLCVLHPQLCVVKMRRMQRDLRNAPTARKRSDPLRSPCSCHECRSPELRCPTPWAPAPAMGHPHTCTLI